MQFETNWNKLLILIIKLKQQEYNPVQSIIGSDNYNISQGIIYSNSYLTFLPLVIVVQVFERYLPFWI